MHSLPVIATANSCHALESHRRSLWKPVGPRRAWRYGTAVFGAWQRMTQQNMPEAGAAQPVWSDRTALFGSSRQERWPDTTGHTRGAPLLRRRQPSRESHLALPSGVADLLALCLSISFLVTSSLKPGSCQPLSLHREVHMHTPRRHSKPHGKHRIERVAQFHIFFGCYHFLMFPSSSLVPTSLAAKRPRVLSALMDCTPCLSPPNGFQ